MATHQELTESLATFRDSCNANERLRAMLADWDRIILVQATDIPSAHTLIARKGEIFLQEGAPDNPDMKVMADSEILADLFYGDITPTEPYMNGTLQVVGSEEDVLRLDFISLLVWGE